MLGVSLDLSQVVIHKDLYVTQAVMDKRLEHIPRDWDRAIYVLLPLVLLPAETDLVPKERRSKKNLSRSCNFSDSKIVLILLTEVLAVYVGLFAVHVWGTGL